MPQQNQQQPIIPSIDLVEKPPGSRRASFRITEDFDKEDVSPISPEKTFDGPTLLIDDDRRVRRRGSQL
jgi:hypothetical protein